MKCFDKKVLSSHHKEKGALFSSRMFQFPGNFFTWGNEVWGSSQIDIFLLVLTLKSTQKASNGAQRPLILNSF